MSQDLANLYIKVDSSGVVTASKNLNDFAGSAKKTETATASVASGFSKLQTAVIALAGSYAALRIMHEVNDMFKKGFLAVEDYKLSVAGLAAMVTTFSQKMKGQDLAGQWKEALKYSTEMVPILENIAAKTLLSGRETMLLNNALARHGVFLDANNEKQIKGFVALSNALPLLTQGQNLSVQLNQEIRGLMTGQGEQTSMLLMTLKKIDPQIEKHVKTWQAQGTVLENINGLLVGFGPASSLLEDTWMTIKSTLDTTATQILRGLMKPVYDEIIEKAKEFDGWLKDNKDNILDWGINIRVVWSNVVGYFQAAAASGLTLYATYLKISALRASSRAAMSPWLSKGESDQLKTQSSQDTIGATAATAAADSLMVKATANIMRNVEAVKEQEKAERALFNAKPGSYKFKPNAGPTEDEIAAQKAAAKALAQAQKEAAQESSEFSSYINVDKEGSQHERLEMMLRETQTYYDKEGVMLTETSATFTEMEQKRRQSEMDNLKKSSEFKQALLQAEHSQALADFNEKKEFEMGASQEAADKAAQQAQLYKDLGGMEDEYRQKKLEWIELEGKAKAEAGMKEVEVAKWVASMKQKMSDESFMRENSDRQAAFASMASNFAAMGQLYAEDSKERQALSNLSKAAMMSEIALQVQKNIMIAVGAVATQGTGDPYTAFARVAAMVAVMAGVLSMAGIAFGSKGGGKGSMAPSGPKSTVLGAEAGTGSESISNSWKLMQDTYDMEYTKLSGIYNEMKDLNKNITGLVTNIIRSGSTGIIGSGIGATVNKTAKDIQDTSLKWFYGSENPINKLDFVGGWVNKQVGKALQSVFGGSTKTSQIGGGMGFGSVSVGNLMSGGGISGYTYADMYKKTDGGWFKKDKKRTWTEYGGIDQSTADLFTQVYKGISETLIELSKGLGTDLNAAMNYVFGAAKINLMGMNADQVSKTLQTHFSVIGDNAVEALFGSMLKGYQQVGEGLMETAVRLIVDKEIILKVLEQTGQVFEGTTSQIISFSEALIDMAGGLDELREATEKYYDKFFSDVEKQSDIKSTLTNVLGSYGYELPGMRADYRSLVESLNLTTDAGMTAYVALMQMSEGADKYYTYLENARSKINPSKYSTNLEYQRAMASFDDGGIASGPLSGYDATLHGTELIVSPRTSYPATVRGGDNGEQQTKALQRIQMSLEAGNLAALKNIAKITRILDRFDSDGMPAERVI